MLKIHDKNMYMSCSLNKIQISAYFYVKELMVIRQSLFWGFIRVFVQGMCIKWYVESNFLGIFCSNLTNSLLISVLDKLLY